MNFHEMLYWGVVLKFVGTIQCQLKQTLYVLIAF
jgi:hypothetical protein